ncbi:HSP20-like chaperone [Dacryopinax primogenitus]|uniref:HSP20-like chaperone n=1 Tax=Dacryopinax primogenitus (strain DJM 731) TaxID=1858805 RepID=M5FYJ0_DACPD|nr:HSP20-like chaperone [Dacryopinax primogenitus]EJU03111.1 HSP20-like chaperone [Dacryopinax primogenitus]
MHDLRPLIRMLDEPLIPSRFPPTSTAFPAFSGFRDPFFRDIPRQPVLDVHEDTSAEAYVVEAELPGVRKEDVEVRIADGGHGLTIEGKVSRRGGQAQEAQPAAPAEGTTEAPSTETQAVTKTEAGALQPSTGYSYESSFSRYVSFPKAVNPEGVTAKLENGVLSLKIPLAEERGSVRVDVL